MLLVEYREVVVCQRVFVICYYECYNTLVKVILISYPLISGSRQRKHNRETRTGEGLLEQTDPIMSYYYSLFANEETNIQFNIYAYIEVGRRIS